MTYRNPILAVPVLLAAALLSQTTVLTGWKHLSSAKGDLDPPGPGKQQTSSVVFDADKDGVNDFVITERTAAPSVVLYRRSAKGWTRNVVDDTALRIEAGSVAHDIDGDGDLDFLAGGDGASNQIWWWENPNPNFDANTPWKRRLVKNSGEKKHHDQMFADTDGDGRAELFFWNQRAFGLYVADIPANPRESGPWPFTPIYTYSTDSEPQHRGEPESFKGPHEHEGLASIDIDGDGKLDVIGGGRWFKHIEGRKYRENLIDPSYTFSRPAAGQMKKGGRPEVVLVVGDGKGPLLWYEWVKNAWIPHKLTDVDSAHSLDIGDVNGDGNLDIFFAEMRLNNRDPNARVAVMLGDGEGNFKEMVIARGFGMHESKLADLDGNGTLDVLGKPYNWETPRIDIWLNPGK
jgi:hypothetical protein